MAEDNIKDKLEGEGDAEDAAASKPKKHRNKKKRLAVLGVIVVVVACCGVGFWNWHEQPSFCAAFCHNMDQYLDTYEEEQGVAGTDKYGNEVSNTNAMLATYHSSTNTTAKPEITCMGCHKPVLKEQVSEAFSFLTGNYLDPLDERTGKELTHWTGLESDQFCANSDCHSYLMDENGLVDRERLEEATADMEFNPHSTHHITEFECTYCHKGHRASVLQCTGCHEHEDVELPEGWVSAEESEELMSMVFSAA